MGSIGVQSAKGSRTAPPRRRHAEEALAQYQQSLAIDAAHAQTLFNVGIVRADGKRDFAGAIVAWETLLKSNPGYPDAAKVRTLIAGARARSATEQAR